ncbi:hypothetical protein [Mycobacterium sp.]|uniref:hypothetical protein n=1 Tax=Mycobacterium sp. TaxID=1785 RepID=UPI002D9E995E|nr:hypothetical protein [Mycobacterium sp.]
MGEVFIGSEAVAAGRVTRHELQRWYRPMYRGVYGSRQPSLGDRIYGAWLASDRRGIVGGVAASAVHGASWVDADIPVELTCRLRPQSGLVVRKDALTDAEITKVAGIAVTTPARTAFDALMRASPFSQEDVLLLAKRHRGARGLKALRAALPLVDGGAASPRETWLRLLYIDAGLPRPTIQIPIVEGRGRLVRLADMGWEEFMVVSEYDGDHHRTSRRQYTKDIRSLRRARALGWIVDQVIKEDRPADIVERARTALISRGWKP